MLGGFSIRETTEITEYAVEQEAFWKVSFREGITKVNKQKSFKENLRIIAMPAHAMIFRLTEFLGEGKVNAVKEDFNRVFRRNHTFNGKVSKGVSDGFSHLVTYICLIFRHL